jgi:hypothetical protein
MSPGRLADGRLADGRLAGRAADSRSRAGWRRRSERGIVIGSVTASASSGWDIASAARAAEMAALTRTRRAESSIRHCALRLGTCSLRWRGIKGVISSRSKIGQCLGIIADQVRRLWPGYRK